MQARLKIGIILKKAAEQFYDKAKRERVRSLSPELFQRVEIAVSENQKSREYLEDLLKKEQFEYRIYEKTGQGIKPEDGTNLILSLGGDGTFIYSSQKGIPMIGINSSPQTSVGHFCPLNLFEDQVRLVTLLKQIESGQKQPFRMDRLAIHLNGKKIPTPILNEILICSSNSAEISSYLITYRDHCEYQRSSGIWLSSYNGSSAAYHSAGGKPFRERDTFGKRQWAFWVREPHKREKLKLLNEVVNETEIFQITSLMQSGYAYIDGAKEGRAFSMFQTLSVGFHPEPVWYYEP